MKSIIVGIDLTVLPVYLIKYSLKLAQYFNARIDFVYVVPSLNLISEKNGLLKTNTKEESLSNFVSQYIGKQHWSLPVFYHESIGAPYKSINQLSNDINADIIIIGKNRKRLFSFFNETQNKLLAYTKRPVLLLPNDIEFTTPQNIIYTAVFSLEDCDSIFTLTEWAAVFKSKLICFNIRDINESAESAEKKLLVLKKIFSHTSIEFKMISQQNLKTAVTSSLTPSLSILCTLHKEKNYFKEIFGYKEKNVMLESDSLPHIIFR